VSDFSDVTSRLITFIGNVVRGRLVSLSKYPPALTKGTKLVNTVLSLIPDEIDIPGTDLYLCGGLDENIHIVKDTSVTIGMDASLLNKHHPLHIQNNAVFGKMPTNDYQISMYLS